MDDRTQVRWVWHDDTFASLMLGRVPLAQVSKAAASENWFYTLFHVRPGERPGHSAPTRDEAIRAAQNHAGKVLTDEQ